VDSGGEIDLMDWSGKSVPIVIDASNEKEMSELMQGTPLFISFQCIVLIITLF
jgi:hypothetical protein